MAAVVALEVVVVGGAVEAEEGLALAVGVMAAAAAAMVSGHTLQSPCTILHHATPSTEKGRTGQRRGCTALVVLQKSCQTMHLAIAW